MQLKSALQLSYEECEQTKIAWREEGYTDDQFERPETVGELVEYLQIHRRYVWEMNNNPDEDMRNFYLEEADHISVTIEAIASGPTYTPEGYYDDYE